MSPSPPSYWVKDQPRWPIDHHGKWLLLRRLPLVQSSLWALKTKPVKLKLYERLYWSVSGNLYTQTLESLHRSDLYYWVFKRTLSTINFGRPYPLTYFSSPFDVDTDPLRRTRTFPLTSPRRSYYPPFNSYNGTFNSLIIISFSPDTTDYDDSPVYFITFLTQETGITVP